MHQTTRLIQPSVATVILLILVLVGGLGCTAAPATAPVPIVQSQVLPTLASTADVPQLPTSTSAASLFADLPPTNTPLPTPTLRGPDPTRTPRPSPTQILFPTETPDLVAEATSTASPTPRIDATYPASDPAYIGRTIDELSDRIYGENGAPLFGTGQITVTEQLSVTAAYEKYYFTYESDGYLVDGFVNIPIGGPEKKPIAIVLHGYVEPSEYELLAYTAEYADSLAANGYVTFHPSYRNHPPADDPLKADAYNTFRVDYAVDVLNLVAILRRETWDRESILWPADTNYVHLMGHSMGGGIALRVLTVWPEAFQAAVLYASMSGDERLNYERISHWRGGRSYDKEVNAPDVVLDAVSPASYYNRLTMPISIHHGSDDELVPVEWSKTLCDTLKRRRIPTECYFYTNYPHNFYGAAEDLFIGRMLDFFKNY